MNRLFTALTLIVVLPGCAYSVKPVSVSATNIYTSYDEKIAGSWVIVADEGMRNIEREISASSYVCSAHTFPMKVGDAISTSVKAMMASVFENTTARTVMPTVNDLRRDGSRGAVLVRLDSFEPRVRCSTGFWTGSCTASTDVSFGVTVRGTEGTLYATSVGDSATVDGDSGGACEGGATVLSESISKSVKKALERMGERLSNSRRLRADDT